MDLIIFLLLLAAIFFFFICLIWFYLAPNNICFTFVDEGTAKVVVRGKKFKKCLMSWRGRTFDLEWNVVEGEQRSFWDFFGGLRWVGFYPFDKIYAHKFRWATLDNEGNIEIHEERWQDYVLLEDDYYAFKIQEAEDKNSVPLDFTMIMTAAPSNVYKWLFNAENSLELTIAKAGPAIKDIIGEYSYEEMVGENDQKKFELDKTFMEILSQRKFFEQFKEYGVDVKSLQSKEIDPPASYREVTLTKRTKEHEAAGISALAEAEAGRIEKVYDTILKHGEDGKFIRMFEAAEKSPLSASLTVVPGLSQMVERVVSSASEKKKSK
ncbi:MAG: SPFH domain-containing protein [Candidatus Pacebacteria bacterium]|nr:SPFH domain-containing protein [Candidatus Paceibacterota bacterium]MDD4830817.1 SPFH domain-containing protein [Candidatus Paceibacterota bacterium]